MKKIFVLIFTILLLITKAEPSMAQNMGVSTSAELKTNPAVAYGNDYRVVILRKYLEKYNSPLAPYSEDSVKDADFYQIDWRLVPSIAGVESTFGKHIPYGSYNAYGWANGNYKFESWGESIWVVTKTLRENYYDKGATSVPKIARIYAPPSTTWAWKVEYFMNKIDPLNLNFTLE